MYYEYPIFDIVNVKAEKNDISKLITCIEKNSINGLNYLLDANESKFNIINKLVFEICNYYLKLLNIPFNSDIIIKCQLKNSHYKTNFSSNNGQVPFFTNILYLNDSDGPTYFYKDEHDDVIGENMPEKNSAILVEGDQYHSSSRPIKYDRRIVLNINLVEVKNDK